MTTLTAGNRAEGFLASEVDRNMSRDAYTLASGQNVVDGQLMKLSTGKLVAAAGSNNSAGDPTEDIRGFIIGDHNVSADTPVVVVARLAVVKDSAIKRHTTTGGGAAAATTAVNRWMASHFIVAR